MTLLRIVIVFIFVFSLVNTIILPNSCTLGEYYEPSGMQCITCQQNASRTTSSDGFSCTCSENSIPLSPARCRPCDVTELVSADGAACVPRRCHTAAGKVACRKCPREYITVTQNVDGSLMREVQCIKCAKGFKPQDNKCVRCEACTCNKVEAAVAGRCIPKKFLMSRPKYTQNILHPNVLMELVKLEYLCTENDVLACRSLGNACVRSFYSTDMAGPCSLWFKPNITTKGLPLLAFPFSNKNEHEFHLEHGKDTIKIVMIEHTMNGVIRILENAEEGYFKCLPFLIKIGKEISCDVVKNVTDLYGSRYNSTYELYVSFKNELKPLPIKIVQNNRRIQGALWPTSKFRKFFLVDRYLSITTNITEMVYLRTLLFKVSISRDISKTGLKLALNVEAHYQTKSPLAHTITTTFEVQHQMPQAGVARSLEILGGVFGCALTVYAVAQWRGAVRRGALHVTILPLVASAVADALYFATLLSTLHSLAAEAGTLGLTLPLSTAEDKLITAMIYSAVALKALKVIWVNIKQCRSNILLIDWSKYNPDFNEVEATDSTDWRTTLVGKEWGSARNRRRVSPGFTASLALLILHFLDIRMSYIPQSPGYRWCIVAISWWTSYTALLLGRYTLDLVAGSPTTELPNVCSGVGVSLLVFQEERYAHYVNGRNDANLDSNIIAGSLATCRLFCSPQLSEIYTKLSTAGYGEIGQVPNKVLLKRFMAAFFERALDGLNWVASERTTLERLLDVELADREGNTSVLLHDNDTTPSCFAVTWWGEEWMLATFDAILFDFVFILTEEPFLAALVTLTVWQVTKHTQTFFWNRRFSENWSIDKNTMRNIVRF